MQTLEEGQSDSLLVVMANVKLIQQSLDDSFEKLVSHGGEALESMRQATLAITRVVDRYKELWPDGTCLSLSLSPWLRCA